VAEGAGQDLLAGQPRDMRQFIEAARARQ